MKLQITKNQCTEVDDLDFDILSKYKWQYLKNGYVATSVGGRKTRKMVYMHRLITSATNSVYVDHIDGDKLNNCRVNLRLCNQSQNGANSRKQKKATSNFKGVYWDKSRGKWTAHIKVNYVDIFLGRFDSEVEAAKKYNEAAIEAWGTFARINII